MRVTYVAYVPLGLRSHGCERIQEPSVRLSAFEPECLTAYIILTWGGSMFTDLFVAIPMVIIFGLSSVQLQLTKVVDVFIPSRASI